MAHLGQTLISPRDRRSNVKDHLWIVLSRPTRDGQVVIANISSVPCPSGEVCTLEPGEHPFVEHTSYVRLLEARPVPAAVIDQFVGDGTARRQPDLGPTVLRRLQHAVAASEAVRMDAVKILCDQGFAGAD